MKYTNDETAKVCSNGSIREMIQELNKNIMANRELTAVLHDQTSPIRRDQPLVNNGNDSKDQLPLSLSEIETMIYDCNESVKRNSKEIHYIIETLRL